MAGIGDSWGTKEELLHPRGPDGRWIRSGGVPKGLIGRILEALANFRPRMFQNQGQANQYLHNVGMRKPSRFQSGRGYGRLLSDLGPTNEDLRDGVIDNPSTSKFIKMMDESATELPDDVILTRHVGVEAFGFTPQTAQGTSSDTDPGIRGMSGKLVADRGYSTTVVGEPRGAPPPGGVRMVIAARKGTKVMVPASGPSDSTVFLDRDQSLRVTKIESDGAGGWVMYAMTEEDSHAAPEPIGGPVGAGTRDTRQREAAVRDVGRITAQREKRPDDTAEAADAAERQRRFEEGQKDIVPSPMQEAERRRVEQLQQEAGVQPRTEPIQARSIGGEPRPETATGGAPTSPEAPTGPQRAVDLRLAVRDAGIASPAAGPNRKRFNDAYEGVISGKKDPIDAARELDRDAADLRGQGDPDADNLEQLSELIKREYGLEQPAQKKAAKAVPRTTAGLPKVTKSQMQELTEREKAAKAGRAAKKAGTAPPTEAPPAPTPVKKAAKSGMTPDQEDRVIARAREFRGKERNDEERRIVGQADDILASRRGEAPAKALPPVAKKAPAKMAAPAAEALTPEQEIKGLFNGKRPTNAQLREMGERNNLGFGSKEPRSEMILAILGARPSRGRQRGEVPVEAPAKKATKRVSTEDRVANLLLERMNPEARDRILADMPEGDRRAVDEAVERVREAGPPTPRKRAAKKAAPISEAPGDDLDRMTKDELLAEAGRRDVKVTKSWTKDRIKGALRGETPAPAKKAAKAGARRVDLDLVEQRLGSGNEITTDEKAVTLLSNPFITMADLRKIAEDMNVHVPASRLTETGARKPWNKESLVRHIAETVMGSRRRTEPGFNVPEAPAPVKKAAKATVPEAAPGTAAGKITASRIQPGMRILVTQSRDGDWVPSNRKTGQTTLTVDRIERQQTRGFRRGGSQLFLVGKDENGNEIRAGGFRKGGETQGVPPHQTFIVAPEPGAAPAKKAAKAAAPDKVQVARARQEEIFDAKRFADTAAELDQLISDDASDKTILSRFDNTVQREDVPGGAIDVVRGHLEAGRRDQARVEMRRILEANGVTPIARAGDVVPFNRREHQQVAGTDIADGDMVRVVRPGHRARIRDEDVDLGRSVVEPANAEEIAGVERGARGTPRVPDGSVKGDRTQAPIDNAPRKREFGDAWDAADLETEGAAGRSLKEIRDDVSSGKITPEEGIRRVEGEIAFNQEDLNEVDANLRQTDLTPEQRTRLQSDAAKLQGAIDAQKKASKFMRLYFKDEKPTVREVEVSLDEEGFRALQEATPESLREAAKIAGMDPPKGNTKEEILQDMVRQVAEKVARERGIIPKKAAKKAVKKAAPEPPKIPTDRERVDAKLLAEGLDVQPGMLDLVQRALDGERIGGTSKNPSPRQIADVVDGHAQAQSSSTVIRFGNWNGQTVLGGERDSEAREEMRLQYEDGMAKSRALKDLAERIRGVRRRKAPAKKAAPEVQAAETRADSAEARLINDRLERVQAARSREAADKELDDLTLPELRRIGESMGIKGRSKRDLRDKILDRVKPEAAPPSVAEPPGAPTPTVRTRSLSARAKGAGIESPGQMFSGVDSGISEADRRLNAGDSHTDVARFLRERATQVSKADLDEEGRRFTTELDKDSLRSLRKSNAEYLRRVATHVQQEGKTSAPAKKVPAKKAAPRPDLGSQVQILARGTTREERAGTENVTPSPSRTGTSPVSRDQATTKAPPVRAMRTSGTDIYDGTKKNKPLKTLDRPKADEPVYLPNNGNDQGRVHLDSELGGLWLDLYYDEREPNSFVNEIARIGEQVGTGELPLAQALQRLARMKGRASDSSVADRIQAAIDEMDAPKMEVPDLPDTVPGAVRRALQRLADIPTARRRQVGSRRLDRTILEEKVDIVRQIDAGEIRMDAGRRLSKRDLHESGDGALEMWRIFERLMNSDWVVGYDDQNKPITEPNPDWPEISAWLRAARERAYARQRGT